MATPSTELTTTDIPLTSLDQFLNFLYTPYGVAAIAVLAIVLTSLVWCIGCCAYCCYRWRQKRHETGLSEANRDLTFYGVASTVPAEVIGEPAIIHMGQSVVHGGTLSSGYNTGPPVSSSSLAQMESAYGVHNTSLDSIISNEQSA